MNGRLHTLSQDKVKILNDYLSSIFTPDKNNDELPSVDKSPYPSISETDLQATLIHLKLPDLTTSLLDFLSYLLRI